MGFLFIVRRIRQNRAKSRQSMPSKPVLRREARAVCKAQPAECVGNTRERNSWPVFRTQVQRRTTPHLEGVESCAQAGGHISGGPGNGTVSGGTQAGGRFLRVERRATGLAEGVRTGCRRQVAEPEKYRKRGPYRAIESVNYFRFYGVGRAGHGTACAVVIHTIPGNFIAPLESELK